MLYFENKQDKITIGDEHVAIVKSVIDLCTKNFSSKYDYEIAISVIFVDDNEMRSINMQHRNIDKTTDVLSFPMYNFDPALEDVLDLDVDFDSNCILLGDIAVSAERSLCQAENYGHSFEREIAFLVSHGVYHILGFSHDDEESEKIMLQLQELALEELGLNR
ncbi:MAG: rRNA maturation RNase YbeY [Bacillota bacterium]